MSDKTLTAELLARLQRHYIKPGELMPGGMFLPEVTLAGRRADALYVGFFASRGKFLVGHELKVSRTDWLHELASAEKAETWFRECHSWYLVAAHESIVHHGELPPGWGLMVPGPSKTRMRIVVQAQHRPDTSPSWAATHAIVQRVDSIRIDGVQSAKERARDDANAEVAERVEDAVARHPSGQDSERADRAEALVATVAEILGLRPVGHSWAGEGEVTVDQLRHSFGAWLAADKETAEALSYRISALKGAQEAIADAWRSIEEIRSAVKGEVA